MEAVMLKTCKRPRILTVAHRFSLGFGGIPESLLLLARELEMLGVQLDVLSKDGFVEAAGRLDRLPMQSATQAGPALNDRVELDSYACVFIAGAWNPMGWWIATRARRRGVRVVYTPKGNLASAEFKRLRDIKKFPYLLSIELSLLAMSQRIIFSSALEARSSLLAGLFRNKSIVLPEPFVGPALAGSRSRRPGPIRFGFMAEIAPRKGLAELTRAFVDWQATGSAPPAELHIAGAARPGSERYYDKVRTSAAAIPTRVFFHGALRGTRRDDFYEDVDYFVCPTRFESFGLTPLEALWHGKPVMVTNKLGVLEFISEDRSVINLGAGDKADILAAFATAVRDWTDFSTAADGWRGRPLTAVSNDHLAREFARELGVGPTMWTEGS
ncbi:MULTISPECIES: glycosyltransferase family 4 protein [Bradyrhizobium]|uniref:glycosyltransferase family 4 protein n=1 Tax=Bradyrhizobium TaxID=374 RepID=UPI001EDAEBFF|nr:glycosyltransferase family 4 protein [Bradyrhizobium zhengyangense]MCG2643788.1 glycosyltransferase family 4 protein [Bradyrhizobium zhengyangense]